MRKRKGENNIALLTTANYQAISIYMIFYSIYFAGKFAFYSKGDL